MVSIIFRQTRNYIVYLCILGYFLGLQTAAASEIKLGGEFITEYERTDYGEMLPADSRRKNIYAVNGTWEPVKNTEAYFRFIRQEYGGDQDLPSESKLDKYGIRIKHNNMQWNLGTQALFLGAFGGLLDLEDKAGDRLFNGIEMVKQRETEQFRVLSGRLGGALFADGRSREMSAVQFSGKFNNTGWAVTALNIPGLDGADRFVDLSLEHTIGKMTYMTEIIRSNGDSGAKAGAAGFFYYFDNNNALCMMAGESGRSSLPWGGAELLGASDNSIRGLRLKTYHLTKVGLFVLEYSKVHSTLYDRDFSNTALTYKIRF